MLFSPDLVIASDMTVVLVHTPATAAIATRRLMARVFDPARCVNSYGGEAERLDRDTLDSYQFISGHYTYGIHRLFRKRPVYLSVIRDPIERYLATYQEFVSNPNSPHHALAMSCDVNQFLRQGLASKNASLSNQFNNLQCRCICGEASFRGAREHIDKHYFLVCPEEAVADMHRLLVSALGIKVDGLEHDAAPSSAPALPAHAGELSSDSIALLLESEKDDLLLYQYVQYVFRQLARGDATAASSSMEPAIPPKSMRFMGEADDQFLVQADRLAEWVMSLFSAARPRNMLDIGCGYGRLAYGLRRARYDGHYTGFDILRRQITWLADNFVAEAPARFDFHFFDSYNERYNPEGKPLAELNLPFADASFDGLVSSSVFTHLYEDETVNYLRYLNTYLAVDGMWVMSAFVLPDDFSLDHQSPTTTYRMVKQVSPHGFIHNLEEPLLVSAFTRGFLYRLFADEGLEVVKFSAGTWYDTGNDGSFQDWFVLRKRDRKLS